MSNHLVAHAISGIETNLGDVFARFPERDVLLEITDEAKARQWIESSPSWNSVSPTLRVRIYGMVKACKGFICVLQMSQIIPEKDAGNWPALVLGSLAICVRVSLQYSVRLH